MADYIKYADVTGRITDKYKSVDGSNLTGNILKIDRETFNALTKYKKVVAEEVLDMSQAEIDALDAELAQATEDSESARIGSLDTKMSKIKIADFTMTKVDTAIDNISNLAEAKVFFKRLVRVIAKVIKRV